jgi:hypothetical protein
MREYIYCCFIFLQRQSERKKKVFWRFFHQHQV